MNAEKALRLFGQRGEQLSPLYTDPAAVTEIPDGVVGKDKLVLKARNIVEALGRHSQR